MAYSRTPGAGSRSRRTAAPPPPPSDPPENDSRGAEREDEAEPVSLAEEIADGESLIDDDLDERYEQIKKSGDSHIAELQKMSMGELIDEARNDQLTDYAGMKRQDLIFKILKERVKLNGLMYGEGTLAVSRFGS